MSTVHKILVVDDEPHVAKLKCAILECTGYSVLAATSCRSAIEIVSHNFGIDLIVTDFRLGDADCASLLRWLVDHKRAIPVIIISGYVAEALRKCGNLPIAFLEKPVNPEALVEFVRASIAQFPANDEQFLDRIMGCWRDLRENQRARQLFADSEQRQNIRPEISGNKPQPDIDYGSVLAATIHDLKGELLHVASAAKTIREINSPAPAVLEEIDVIDRSLAYAKGVLRRMLNLLELGSSPPSRFGILGFITDIQRLVNPRLPPNIQLRVEISESLKATNIMADKDQLTAIFLELCMNATKAIKGKAGLIEISIAARGSNVEFTIKDNGPGIAPTVLPKLFHQQVPSDKGAGIGLFLSARIIRAFQGDLGIRSNSSKGTEMLVTLPISV